MRSVDAEAWAIRVEKALRTSGTEYDLPPLVERGPGGEPSGRVASGDALVFASRHLGT